ncbi:MAG: hypothetical protein KVP17_003511 [Porospora cf. gigantea B]|nr:MAG: hypothetical protein KVP17_003511 [Porospora cf. gigantea B]
MSTAPLLLQQPECPYLLSEASTENAFLKADLNERRRRIRLFWSAVYRSQESRWGPILPPKELLEAIPVDCHFTGAEKSYFFTCVCGLGPLFDLNPKTGRVTFTNKGVSADFSLFKVCNITMLEKLSAWHWLQMYDDGLLEPTSNPSVILSCLGLNDRLQYLREMTSTRSVLWLEQARWLAVDCMGEAAIQSKMEIVQSITSDMSFLLQLLEELMSKEERSKEGIRYIDKRYVIIVLFLHFLGLEPIKEVDYRMAAHGISQAFSTIRCGLLDRTRHREDHSRLLSAVCASLQTVSRGWSVYGRNLGVDTTMLRAPSLLDGLQQPDGGMFYPLFLNPHALCHRSWDEAKRHPGIRHYTCYASSTFTDRSNLLGVRVRDCKRPTCLTDMLSLMRTSDQGSDSHPNCRRKSDGMRFFRLLPSDLASASNHCAVVRQLRKLEAVRQFVTRVPGCFNLMLGDLSLPEADTSRLRQQVIAALLLGLSNKGTQHVKNVEATDVEATVDATVEATSVEAIGAAFFLRTNALCFCQHSLLPSKTTNAAFALIRHFDSHKWPAWGEIERRLTEWWRMLHPVELALDEIEAEGYDQHPSDDWEIVPKNAAAYSCFTLSPFSKCHGRLQIKLQRRQAGLAPNRPLWHVPEEPSEGRSSSETPPQKPRNGKRRHRPRHREVNRQESQQVDITEPPPHRWPYPQVLLRCGRSSCVEHLTGSLSVCEAKSLAIGEVYAVS